MSKDNQSREDRLLQQIEALTEVANKAAADLKAINLKAEKLFEEGGYCNFEPEKKVEHIEFVLPKKILFSEENRETLSEAIPKLLSEKDHLQEVKNLLNAVQSQSVSADDVWDTVKQIMIDYRREGIESRLDYRNK